MIGSALLVGTAAALGLGVVLGLRPAGPASADPPREAERRAATAAAASRAVARIDALELVVEAAIANARRGSAAIIDGPDPPEPALIAAADELEAGAGSAGAAQRALRELSGMLAAVDGELEAPLLDLSEPDLLVTAAQLRASAEAAGPFVERRHATEATLEALAAALVALEANRPDDADAAIAEANAARGVVAAWEEPPPELSHWLETTAAMLGAAQRIADALRDGDAAAAMAAGAEYRAAAERAALADRALALVVAESGSAITAAPLAQLARASQALAEARSATTATLERLGP